ncbi:MAG TPA: tetratricopeptide repeat protein [Terriglobia bacterium]|nr:tetratricopeptide repeat protein [Terriglobia bacterium]
MSHSNSHEKRSSDAAYQAAVKNFEAAIRYLQKQNYEKAKESFEKVLEGHASEISDRARVYLRVCEQKLEHQELTPKTAQEFYLLAVAQLNARQLESAFENLQKANQMQPNRGHIRYALAAVHALQGNTDAALEHLKAAIELEPRNRIQARRDEDLQSLAQDSRFKRLVFANSFVPSGTTS